MTLPDRYRPGARRHFLSEILQRCGHHVTAKQTEVWIHETITKNKLDDDNRTDEAKAKRIKRKHSKYLKSYGDGRECMDHYKSGGKRIKREDVDLMKEQEEDITTEAYPATEIVLRKFSIKGLRTITERVLKSVNANIPECTNHIPTEGRGQKDAWLTLLLKLAADHNVQNLSVPIEGSPHPQPHLPIAPHTNPNTHQFVQQRINWCRHLMCFHHKL